MIAVVLAEDQHVVRQGLRALLETQTDIRVVAEASDDVEALELVERFQPDVLVTAVSSPSLDGLDLTRQIRARLPRTQVVVLSAHTGEQDIRQAFASGAVGYVEKTAETADLIEAVRLAARGERYANPPTTTDRASAETAEPKADPEATLTPRERQVLQLAAEGRTNAQMGVQLGISPRTIEVHRANLMRKLRLRSRTELVRYALKRGILPLE